MLDLSKNEQFLMTEKKCDKNSISIVDLFLE